MSKLVISASRRTDIPAFFMPWFMNSVNRGFFEVINPYNQRTAIVPATPEKVHTIVFWSKNFGPFIDRGDGIILKERGYHLFFNFTINSPHPILEPAMPSLERRLGQLAKLADVYGPKSIQWRFDPICFYRTLSGAEGDNLDHFQTIASRVQAFGIRLCITSFVDIYRKVTRRLKRTTTLELYEPSLDRKVETIAAMVKILDPMGIDLQLCCENEVLAAMGHDTVASASACIPNDRLAVLHGPGISLARDQGQRTKAGCRCGISKDIGSYNLHPCRHNCLFCYANPAMDKKKKNQVSR